jgi:hypothetical protein
VNFTLRQVIARLQTSCAAHRAVCAAIIVMTFSQGKMRLAVRNGVNIIRTHFFNFTSKK